MSEADPKIEAFYAKPARWRDELSALRGVLLDCPVAEDFKWGKPCYTAHGGGVVAVWRMKTHCALAFFKGVLLKDEHGLLVAPGENSRSMRTIPFTSRSDIAAMEDVVKDYVREAVELERAGRKVEFHDDDLVLPDELIDKMDEDPDLRSAFEALTPGRQRGYTLYFSQAKRSETRVSRIEKCIPRIFAGKGLHDR